MIAAALPAARERHSDSVHPYKSNTFISSTAGFAARRFVVAAIRHQELDKRVTAAELGTAPMGDLALMKLKKEKLYAKDQLARIMDSNSG